MTSARNLGPTEVKRLQREWRHRTEVELGLILDNVQTPFNVGAILRTAAALRAGHVWLTGSSASPSSEKTRKTSLGTERFVEWRTAASAAEAAEAAREAGMRVVGLELATGARPVFEVDLRDAVCFVVGHEDRGLSSGALAVCDGFVYLPSPGKVGSLNVATAAALAMYEARRQQWSTSTS